MDRHTRYDQNSDFLAYLTAEVGPYSQIKILSFYPIHRKKSVLKVIKLQIPIRKFKIFETRATLLIQCFKLLKLTFLTVIVHVALIN